MIRQLLTVLLLFIATAVYSQQQAVYSNFLLNDYYYNPAIAGSKDVHVATLGYRNQWTGFEGAPVNINAAFYGSVRNKTKHGYGVSFINEKIGITNKAGIYLNYAYQIRLSEKVKLGLGIRPGYLQYGVKLYNAQLADEGDAVLTGNVYSAGALDVSTGFNLYTRNFFLMGSVNQLLGKSVSFAAYNASLAFHYNLIAGYTFSFPKKKFDLQPSVMLKYTDPAPVQFTAMVKGTYNKKIWAGLIYRSSDACGLSLGVTIKERFNIGYGYDYTIAGLRKFQSGSHEIMLSFVLTKKKPTLDEEDEKLNKSIMDDIQRQNENEAPKETAPTQPTSPDNTTNK